jgi:hypothetical protein
MFFWLLCRYYYACTIIKAAAAQLEAGGAKRGATVEMSAIATIIGGEKEGGVSLVEQMSRAVDGLQKLLIARLEPGEGPRYLRP